MSESVQFWLDNKVSAGIKAAVIGDQALVVYREKFYVVENGAAHSRGGKALRYSRSSLPPIWKRALKGEMPSADGLVQPPDDALPTPTTTARVRVKKEPAQSVEPAPSVALAPAAPVPVHAVKVITPARSANKITQKPVVQSSVTANCPECNFKHDFSLEKGRNGKPFFVACSKCKAEFAVRFVPATIYQAQVAGFR